MWDSITQVISDFNSQLWGWPVIILIMGTGVLFSIRLKFFQFRKFGFMFRSTIVTTMRQSGQHHSDDPSAKTVSQYQAFATAVSGTVGTGNIIGVVAAILAGGPGAVFWMWVSAFIGMLINYAETVLSLYFRRKNDAGEFVGGVMYYIYYGLKWKWMAYAAAAFCGFSAVNCCGVQANKIASTLSASLGAALKMDPALFKIIVSVCIAALAAVCIIGGIKRIGKVAAFLVPIMSLFFVAVSLGILAMNLSAVPGAIASIFRDAFTLRSTAGGILGYGFMTTLREGTARGVFSNEAGLGNVGIVYAASETREPVKQGLWAIFGVFVDTILICTLTALTFLCTMDIGSLTGGESDTDMALEVFGRNFGPAGVSAFSVILFLFVFSTIIACSYYGEKTTEFLFRNAKKKTRKNAITVYKILFISMTIVFSMIDGKLIWVLCDTANGLIIIPNLLSIVIMNGLVVKITKNYFARRKGRDVTPMLSAYPEQNEQFCREVASGPEEMR